MALIKDMGGEFDPVLDTNETFQVKSVLRLRNNLRTLRVCLKKYF